MSSKGKLSLYLRKAMGMGKTDKTTITSHNQSGGITAKNVSGVGDPPPPEERPKWRRGEVILLVLAALGAIVAVLTYLGFVPWSTT